MTDQLDVTNAARLRFGLLAGLLGGLAFSLAAWGLDALELALAHGLYFWARLVLCVLPCILLSMLVSWLVFRFSSGVLRVILWGAAGAAFAWMAGHAPNQGASFLLDQFNPALARLVDYPFNGGFAGRLALAYIVVIALFLLISLVLAPMVEDSALDLGYKKIVPVGLWLVTLVLVGLALDNLTNLPVRQPLVLTNTLIQSRLDLENRPDYATVATESGLRALNPIQDLIHRPRRLLLGGYDDTVETVDVLIDFDGIWAHCKVANQSPAYCERLKK